MDYNAASLKMHEEAGGKLEVALKVPVETKDDLSTAYTPGVAEPCRKIAENPDDESKLFRFNLLGDTGDAVVNK